MQLPLSLAVHSLSPLTLLISLLQKKKEVVKTNITILSDPVMSLVIIFKEKMSIRARLYYQMKSN